MQIRFPISNSKVVYQSPKLFLDRKTTTDILVYEDEINILRGGFEEKALRAKADKVSLRVNYKKVASSVIQTIFWKGVHMYMMYMCKGEEVRVAHLSHFS